MRLIVGVSDMKLSNTIGDTIVTYALGSCIGIVIYDKTVHVGGILHYMLPLSRIDQGKAQNNPHMFGDTGIPELFKQAYKLGAKKETLRVIMSGGAQVLEQNDFFSIGKKNITIARKMFWKNNVFIDAEHVGGTNPRTMFLEIESGKVWITSNGSKIDL